MPGRRWRITKSFLVTGITSTDPGVVRSDDVLKRAIEALKRTKPCRGNEDENDDDLTEDPFTDIELED